MTDLRLRPARCNVCHRRVASCITTTWTSGRGRFITGAGCGMGVNIAKAALATGNAVIATGITKETSR